MQPAKRIAAIALILAVIGAFAQGPIAMGPGLMTQVFNWNLGTGVGCSTAQGANGGPRGMCTNFNIQADTYYFTAWLANASQLPVTTGLPIIGTGNDLTWKTCAANLSIAQLAEFSWSSPNAARVYEVNCMTSYGASGGTNVPAGWLGHCSNGDDATTTVCTWKSREPFALDGCQYLPIERQVSAGNARIHDATMIKSCDAGQTWSNPFTIANSLPAQANGDAPLCGALNSSPGSTCLSPSYAGSIMWPSVPANSANVSLDNWYAYQYGQDGSLPVDVGGPCDPNTYVCFMLADSSFARVLRTDLPSLDVTKWQYVSALDSHFNPTFTSVFANRLIGAIACGTDSEVSRPRYVISSPVYLKEFKSYMVIGGTFNPHAMFFMMSPGPFGPFQTVGYSVVSNAGFATIALGIQYQVISTTPPRIRVTVPTDNIAYTLQLSQWDLTLGRQPYKPDETSKYLDTGHGRVNAGWQFGSGEENGNAPAVFIQKGLEMSFDFMDAGGSTVDNGYPFFHDVVNNSATLIPCVASATPACGIMYCAARGTCALSNGVQIVGTTGGNPRFETNLPQDPIAVSAGSKNAPSAIKGNGTYTIAGVFRMDGAGSNASTTLWHSGTAQTSLATLVGLSLQTTGQLGIDWGTTFDFHWSYRSTLTVTTGNWYFISAVVNGTSTPTAKLWVGNAGSITDWLQGAAYTKNGGSPPVTPNVASAPFEIGGDGSSAPRASYAGLHFYNRALSTLENQQLYRTFKLSMATRGITIQ